MGGTAGASPAADWRPTIALDTILALLHEVYSRVRVIIRPSFSSNDERGVSAEDAQSPNRVWVFA